VSSYTLYFFVQCLYLIRGCVWIRYPFQTRGEIDSDLVTELSTDDGVVSDAQDSGSSSSSKYLFELSDVGENEFHNQSPNRNPIEVSKNVESRKEPPLPASITESSRNGGGEVGPLRCEKFTVMIVF
jgi:hypothetical protein